MSTTTVRPALHRPDRLTRAVGVAALVSAALVVATSMYGDFGGPAAIASLGLLLAGAMAVLPNPTAWAAGRWVRPASIGAAVFGGLALFLALTVGSASATGDLDVAAAGTYLLNWVLVVVGAYVLAVRFGSRDAWAR